MEPHTGPRRSAPDDGSTGVETGGTLIVRVLCADAAEQAFLDLVDAE